MPADYYCSDNFFKKMTDLDSPKRNNDCYFYYYSTCSKGDECGFRHEPSALGCETVCSFWKEGKCLNVHCNFRHMELRKNRKAIACYWESQPGGCLKPHCPFMHQKRQGINEQENKLNKAENTLAENCTQASSFRSTPSVDSLVVNFEEESDSESAVPSASPAKITIAKVKTLEEIKLEKIAAASAAYYSYHDPTPDQGTFETPVEIDLRQKILKRERNRVNPTDIERVSSRKLSASEIARILGDDSLGDLKRKSDQSKSGYLEYNKRRKVTDEKDQSIKIKTLEEIRAERNARLDNPANTEQTETVRNIAEAEVSSTSNDDAEMKISDPEPTKNVPLKPLRRLNIKKILAKREKPVPEKQTKSDNNQTTELTCNATKQIEKPPEINLDEDSLMEEVPSEKEDASFKTFDETLLLLDDVDDDTTVNIKSEEDLLKDIDDMLDS